MRHIQHLPMLDESICVRCGDCAAACPTECLEIITDQPWLARPTECTSCGVCVTVCPSRAIKLIEDSTC